MVSHKSNFFILILCFIIALGVTAPMVAQHKMIIGKQTSYKKNSTRPIATKTNLKRLAHQITRGKTTDAEKAKSIFTWIATTIEYDTELRLSKKLQQEIYISETNVIFQVLKRKKALCGGYAFLFKELCIAVGVEAEVVHGFIARGNRQQNTSSQPNHTWNAVKIDGSWKLLDITWAVSHSVQGMAQTFWYDTNPKDFIKTHIPKDLNWKLL